MPTLPNPQTRDQAVLPQPAIARQSGWYAHRWPGGGVAADGQAEKRRMVAAVFARHGCQGGSAEALAADGSVLDVFLDRVACRMAAHSLASVERLAAPVALDVHLEDGGMMDEAVQGGRAGGLVGEHPVPFPEVAPKGWCAAIRRDRGSV